MATSKKARALRSLCRKMHKVPPDKITTANGLLYRDGHVIHLPEADSVAIGHGYQCAEEMVRALAKRK